MNNIESKVLSSNTIDKYGILKFYKDYVDIIDRPNFIEYCLAQAKSADIIHIHSVEQLVIKIRKVFGNSKKIILHYHGTDIRGLKNKNNPNSSTIQNTKTRTKSFAAKVKNRLRLMQIGYYRSLRTESQELADVILVSTPDLLSLLPKAKYLPNPVDVDHFSKDETTPNKVNNNNALTIKTTSGDIQ
jgi:glycosyltransferase involved in cell wall biosynthesis